APAAAEAKPAVEAKPAGRAAVNEELLSIYLDEAAEVLASIDGAIPGCRQDANNRDALTTIRRGFHTLKGSGRMVGLMDLGEVAWEIEQVMNRWLEQQRPATKTLLELISMASEAFAGWVKQLREGTLMGEIDGGRIVERARRGRGRGDQRRRREDGAQLFRHLPRRGPGPHRHPHRRIEALGGRARPRCDARVPARRAYAGEQLRHRRFREPRRALGRA